MDWVELGKDAYTILAPYAMLLLTVAASWAAGAIARRLGVELSEAHRKAFAAVARDAIAAAEERAARELKVAGVAPDKAAMAEAKAAWALAAVKAVYPKAADSAVLTAIDAELARGAGTGATRLPTGV
jgi:hypothetical protein